jgi:hypothetical protein
MKLRQAVITAAVVLSGFALTLCLASKPKQISAAEQQNTDIQGQGKFSGATSKTEQNTTDEKTLHWYASPEWVLVIVGSLTFLFVGWQAYETRRAADASNKSARAFVNSERAWIAAELIPIAAMFQDKSWRVPIGDNWKELSTEQILKGEHLKHRLRITNMGKTPAFITKWTVECVENRRRELVNFGLPYRSLGAGEHLDVWDNLVDVHGDIKADYGPVGFEGTVFYLHVFDRTKLKEEPFGYSFNRDTKKLERLPHTTPQE